MTPDVFAILPTVQVVNSQGGGELRYVLYGSVFRSQILALSYTSRGVKVNLSNTWAPIQTGSKVFWCRDVLVLKNKTL